MSAPPYIAFICGHVYHEQCLDADSSPESNFSCPKCRPKQEPVTAKNKQYREQASQPEKFMKELESKTRKLNVISDYYGKALFIDALAKRADRDDDKSGEDEEEAEEIEDAERAVIEERMEMMGDEEEI